MALQPDSASAKVSRPIILASAGRQAATREGIRMNAIDIVIMAAGKGTRMKSRLPKVLHRLAGRPLLQHVLETASALGADGIVFIPAHAADAVEGAVAAPQLAFVRQIPQLGTGNAVQQAVPRLHDGG